LHVCRRVFFSDNAPFEKTIPQGLKPNVDIDGLNVRAEARTLQTGQLLDAKVYLIELHGDDSLQQEIDNRGLLLA